MKFEKFLLDDYLQTEAGKKVFSFFSNLKDIYFNKRKKFYQFVDSLLEVNQAEDYFHCDDQDKLFFSEIASQVNKKIKELDVFIIKSETAFNNNWQPDFRVALGWVPIYSLFQFFEHPDYCFPYLFPSHFYKLSEICSLFEISIPQLPGKSQYYQRCCYYFDLCRTMYDFRKQHNMTPLELAVFLYGFAPRFLEKFIESELPEPNRIFVLGASDEDANYLSDRKIGKNEIFLWQGCSEILPGDIIYFMNERHIKELVLFGVL